MEEEKNIIASLDIGTTKVSLVIGEITNDNFQVIGMGEEPNFGVRQGEVIHIEETTRAIEKAKKEAEQMAGVEVTHVWLGVSGSHISSFDSKGMVAIRNEKVTEEDIHRVIETAKAIAIPNNRYLLHVLPNGYKVDSCSGIYDPIGMSGVRLEASARIVTGEKVAIKNAIHCVKKAGLEVQELVLQTLASSLAVLTEDEKRMGVTLVDMGGGSCDLISYNEGKVIHTCSLPIGGKNFTSDVAYGLKTTLKFAEELKRKYGSAIQGVIDSDEVIEFKSVDGRQNRNIRRWDLCEIIEARTEETLRLIQNELVESGLISQMRSGVVFTGGVVQLPQFLEMSEYIFDNPVRVGYPAHLEGFQDMVSSTSCSTGVGLLLYALQSQSKNNNLTHSNSSVVRKLTDFFTDMI